MKETNNNYISDDEVTILGGSEWKPGRKSGKKKVNRWMILSICLAAALTGVAIFFSIRHLAHITEFVQSRNEAEVIASLNTPMPGMPGVSVTTEEALGVKMKIYKLSGLKAHFADTVPQLTDSSVYFVSRGPDYKIVDNIRKDIGDFVLDGQPMASSNWRSGFMAIVDGNAQIGISRSNSILKHVIAQKGSMFRQISLVSAGLKCPKQYILKGKVTRCAYALRNGSLNFVETQAPETLHGFADALIELGFIDAIYVTGGSQPDCFYRTSDGTAHGNFIDDKSHRMVVWTK